MKVLDNLLYTKEHEWVKVEGNTFTFGITDHAQNMLGGIVYVELPEEDDDLEVGENFAVIESVKAATDIVSPLDGKVLEVNEELDDSPEMMNEKPYEAWMLKAELTDASQLETLMDKTAYEAFCAEEA